MSYYTKCDIDSDINSVSGGPIATHVVTQIAIGGTNSDLVRDTKRCDAILNSDLRKEVAIVVSICSDLS